MVMPGKCSAGDYQPGLARHREPRGENVASSNVANGQLVHRLVLWLVHRLVHRSLSEGGSLGEGGSFSVDEWRRRIGYWNWILATLATFPRALHSGGFP